MQITSDGGELVGIARFLVGTFNLEPQTPDFPFRIVSASITGLDAYAASPGELNRIDKKVCRYLRALDCAKAFDCAATECHGRSWTNAQPLLYAEGATSTSGDRNHKSKVVASNDGAQSRTGQHSRDGHEREPRVHQEGRRERRGAATPKAAPTNRQPNQARRWSHRLNDSGGQALADSEVEQQSLNKIMLKAILKTHQTMRDGVGHSADWGEEPPGRQQTQTHAERVRQEERGHTRGPPFVNRGATQWAREQRTRPFDLLGSSGTPSTKPNLRRGSTLQAGRDVKRRRQENHAEHRVARETDARSRSTRSNRRRAWVWTSTTHSHGTRATDVSGRSLEDVKIMVKAFFAEKRRASEQQGVAQRHAERAHTTHVNRSRTTTKVREREGHPSGQGQQCHTRIQTSGFACPIHSISCENVPDDTRISWSLAPERPVKRTCGLFCLLHLSFLWNVSGGR